LKTLILGSNGQAGWELQRALAPLGSVISLSRLGDGGLAGDLADPGKVAETVRKVSPDVIVNAAAYTAVDRAEAESDRAELINTSAVSMLAGEARSLGAWLVHYSTDYVFDGSGTRPWQENDAPAPLNVYGKTKRDGELGVEDSGCRHLIFRTSWVYAARGNNFIHSMLRLASERDALDIVDDQYGAPTGAALIADVTAHALRMLVNGSGASGLFHLTASGETTWHGYATRIVERAREAGWPVSVAPGNIKPIGTDAFPTKARRPRNSRLDCTRLEQTFGLRMPPWQAGVDHALSEILHNEMTLPK
jgi:dTDP-4-dehydrorhamnose reductase